MYAVAAFPWLQNGKEHYVFFAFPHIAINSAGEVGAIARPGRPNKSCACGALQKALIELKAEGYEENCKVRGQSIQWGAASFLPLCPS
jgi:hypothetical protein